WIESNGMAAPDRPPGSLYGLPLRLLVPSVEHGLSRAQRGVGAGIADVGGARRDRLDDLLTAGALIERAPDLPRNGVPLALSGANADQNQLLGLYIEQRLRPDGAEAILQDR